MLKFLHQIFKKENASPEHNAVLNSIGTELTQAGADADQIKIELSPGTATEQWLDSWGSWFGVVRIPGEIDGDYRARVLNVMSDKATIPALVDIAKRTLGLDTIVSVYEPYNEIRYFNRSSFSENGRFEDGDYYRIGVVDLIVNKPITQELQDVENLASASGISVRFTYQP